MADREERLAGATRNYVIFGLLFVVAVGLALFDWFDPRERRGESDSALRLLMITTDLAGPAANLVDLDGFNVAQVGPEEAITVGRELLDEPEPAYRAAIAYADQLGFGLVVLDLAEQPAIDWELAERPPDSARFVVFSVGDVADDGPRMHAVGLPEGLAFDPKLAALDSVRLGIFEHPDFTRLWTIEPNAAELQARRVFDSRKLNERRATMRRDHADWRTLADSWPGPERMPGSLAGAWERVQAAPVPGGLLLEIRSVRIHVDAYRHARLELATEATLEFLPAPALRDDAPDHQQRRPCVGLPERVSTPVAVAPGGSALVIGGSSGQSELFVFEQRADDPDPQCRARSVGVLAIGERAVGRPSASGAMAWSYDDDWLHWWDALGEHRVRIEGADAYSGPWWVDGDLLALIGERTTTPAADDDDEFTFEYEPALVLLATAASPDHDHDETRIRVSLGASELFPSTTEPPELPALLDLRPAGARELLLTTERCPDTGPDDERPCLHRVHAAAPLSATVRELATETRPRSELLAIETLGPIDPHVELAVAADGSRVAWIDRETRSLQVADLRGPKRMIPRRLDRESTPNSSLRISSDGSIVLSEVEVEFVVRENVIGSVRIPSAFLLEPPAQ